MKYKPRWAGRGMIAGAIVCALGAFASGLSCPEARAASAGNVGANDVVGAVMVSRTATSELKNGDGESDAAVPDLLPSRLELTAGTDGLFVYSDVSRQISLFAEARYRLGRILQLGGSLAYRYQSDNHTSDTAFQGLVGPTFNFGSGPSLTSAFFISPQIGLTTGNTKFGDVVVGSNTEFTMALHAGKRFQISQNIAYAPSIGVVKESDFQPSFVIQPVSLSVFF